MERTKSAKRIAPESVNHQSLDKTKGKRCGICRFYRKIPKIETNMIGSCDIVNGVKRYGDVCNRFQVREAAIPDWYKSGNTQSFAEEN